MKGIEEIKQTLQLLFKQYILTLASRAFRKPNQLVNNLGQIQKI